MALYFLLIAGQLFDMRIRPALAESWRQRRFAPCELLCDELIPEAQAFCQRFHIDPEGLLIAGIRGCSFDRALWRHLVGEILWISAAEIPDIQTTPEALTCLLGADPAAAVALDRARLAPIQQAYLGARDLTFGSACYRPAAVGYNHQEDVARLADYLGSLDPALWSPELLTDVPGLSDDQDRCEELEFAREWLPALQDLYRRARHNEQLIICETVSS
jgi:hypothetical protein